MIKYVVLPSSALKENLSKTETRLFKIINFFFIKATNNFGAQYAIGYSLAIMSHFTLLKISQISS